MQVVISPDFQIVIPKQIREAMDLKPGEKLRVFQYHNQLEFVRVKNVKKMRGFLKGIETRIERDEDRV